MACQTNGKARFFHNTKATSFDTSALRSPDPLRCTAGLEHVAATPASPCCRELCNSTQINKEAGLEIIAFIVLLYMCIIESLHSLTQSVECRTRQMLSMTVG